MNWERLTIAAAPYVLAGWLLLTQNYVRTYATRNLRVAIGEDILTDSDVGELCIRHSIFVFTQLTYVFAVLLASVTCLALTVSSPHPVAGIVCVVVFLGAIGTWVMRYSGLRAEQLEGREGVWMRVVAWAAVVVQALLAVYAQASN